ncbi:MAG TPA: hypothetical protein VNA24_06160 [Hyalangium sp.]|nr:hypothetical protein [Hyalangium sp.]
MKYHVQPFGYSEHPATPTVELGKESIKLAVSALVHSEGRLEFEFHAIAKFPEDMEARYRSLGEALVLVVNDIDQRDGFAVRTYNDFIRWVDDRMANLVTPPALPLPPRGALKARRYSGAYVNGVVSFQVVPPVHRPSVFLYMVLENYVSNVIGLDLLANRAIEL